MEELVRLYRKGGMHYHLYIHSLCIISPVKAVTQKGGGLKIEFEGGTVTVWEEDQIRKVHRPSNLVIDCEYCYELKNEHGDYIGYLYKSWL